MYYRISNGLWWPLLAAADMAAPEADDLWARIEQQNAEVVIERTACVVSEKDAMAHERMVAQRALEAAAAEGESLAGLAASERPWKPKDGGAGYVSPEPVVHH